MGVGPAEPVGALSRARGIYATQCPWARVNMDALRTDSEADGSKRKWAKNSSAWLSLRNTPHEAET